MTLRLDRLDHAGMEEMLKSSGVAVAVNATARAVAASVRASRPEARDVVVDSYVTDRAAASVTIRDRRGRLWQVRDGILTRAAAAAGLDVNVRGG